VVVVDEVGAGTVAVVVCSVVVVLVTFSLLPQAAIKMELVSKAATVKSRRRDVVSVMR
jgi:hypothetical protein